LRRRDCDSIKKKNHFTVAYWSNLQFVMAFLPPARPRCDDDSPWIKCSRLFSWSNRSRVASVGERPCTVGQSYSHIDRFVSHSAAIKWALVLQGYSLPQRWRQKPYGSSINTRKGLCYSGNHASKQLWKSPPHPTPHAFCLQRYILTPCSIVLLEKLIIAQPVKKVCLLRNATTHYRIHNSLPLNHILSQLKTAHAYIPTFVK
jgi:hypothetical protein